MGHGPYSVGTPRGHDNAPVRYMVGDQPTLAHKRAVGMRRVWRQPGQEEETTIFLDGCRRLAEAESE